jgi:hypothetical protein
MFGHLNRYRDLTILVLSLVLLRQKLDRKLVNLGRIRNQVLHLFDLMCIPLLFLYRCQLSIITPTLDGIPQILSHGHGLLWLEEPALSLLLQ